MANNIDRCDRQRSKTRDIPNVVSAILLKKLPKHIRQQKGEKNHVVT